LALRASDGQDDEAQQRLGRTGHRRHRVECVHRCLRTGEGRVATRAGGSWPAVATPTR